MDNLKRLRREGEIWYNGVMRLLALGLAGGIVALIAAGSFLDSQHQLAQEDLPKKVAQQVLELCFERGGRKPCYFQEFEKISLGSGHAFAFQVLKEVQKTDPSTLSCHLIAHSIGEGAFKRSPQDWESQVDSISQACTYGAIHGTVGAYAASSAAGLSKELLQQVCREASPGSCWHIVGHLTLLAAQGDLPSALEICSVFKKESQRFSCLAGAFMENITELNLLDHGYRTQKAAHTPERLQGLASLCNSYAGARREACWKEIVHAVPRELRENSEAFFAFCATAAASEAALQCKLHAVNILNSQYKYHLPSLGALCASEGAKDPIFEQRCYPYVAKTMLLMVPEKLPEALAFCAQLKEPFQNDCQAAVASTKLSSPEPLEELCASLPQEDQEYCRENANLK